MTQPIEALREQNKIKLIALACEHLQLEGIASAMIPFGERVIVIGMPEKARELLAATSAEKGGDEGAALLAEIFNQMTREQKLSVPQVIAGRIGEYMVRNGYRIVFGRWYLQTEADRAAAQPAVGVSHG